MIERHEASCDGRFSFSDLKALPKQEQITTHFCIQGWSGVAKWGGVPMRDILDIVKPTPDARYVVFYSFSEGSAGGGYYDVHEILVEFSAPGYEIARRSWFKSKAAQVTLPDRMRRDKEGWKLTGARRNEDQSGKFE